MSIKLHYDPNSEKKLLAEFSNGMPFDRTEGECKLYREKRQNNSKLKERKMLFVKGKHVNYIGNNFQFRSSHPYACKYALAKIDRKTMTAQIFDTDFFKLRPINKTNVNEDNPIANLDVEPKESFREKDLQLVNAFGTSIAKASKLSARRTAQSDTTLSTDVDAVVRNQEKVLVDDDFTSFTQLLSHNKDAESVEDIYPIFDIIPMNVFYSVSDVAEQFVRSAKDDIDQWKKKYGSQACLYLQQHILHPGKDILKSDDLFKKYAICLQFIMYLLQLVNSKDKHKKRLFEKSSNEVEAYFLSTFLVAHGRGKVMSDRLKNKAVATAIVLAWHLDSFSVKTDLIKDPFGLTTDRFSYIVKFLGGEVKYGRARLTYPLKFPREYKMQKRLSSLYK